jgi:hypothetical protein
VDIDGIALLVDPKVDESTAVEPGFSLRFGELRFDLIDHYRRGDLWVRSGWDDHSVFQ